MQKYYVLMTICDNILIKLEQHKEKFYDAKLKTKLNVCKIRSITPSLKQNCTSTFKSHYFFVNKVEILLLKKSLESLLWWEENVEQVTISFKLAVGNIFLLLLSLDAVRIALKCFRYLCLPIQTILKVRNE